MPAKVGLGAVSDWDRCAELGRFEELGSPGPDFIPAEFFEAHIDEDEMVLVAEFKGNVELSYSITRVRALEFQRESSSPGRVPHPIPSLR